MAEQNITPEELKKVQDVQIKFTVLTRRYGELHFQRKLVQLEMSDVDDQMEKLEDERIQVLGELQAKYGAGSIDINTGLLIPAPTSPTTEAAVTPQ